MYNRNDLVYCPNCKNLLIPVSKINKFVEIHISNNSLKCFECKIIYHHYHNKNTDFHSVYKEHIK